MLIRQMIQHYEEFCPLEDALEGDFCGLQFGSLDQSIQRVMVALDIREQTVAEAIEKKIDLIIVKHAPIFRPIKTLVADQKQHLIYLSLIQHGIAVYVSHTNIDVVDGGLNDWFCEKLGISNVEILKETQAGKGIGRVGQIEKQSLLDFAETLKIQCQLPALRLVCYDNPATHQIARVAICGGSAQEFYKEAVKKEADVYVTGDISYHVAQDMLTAGLFAMDPGHHIEVLFIEKITQLFEKWKTEHDWPIEIIASQSCTNPFWFVGQ